MMSITLKVAERTRITRHEIKNYAAAGLSHKQIAKKFGISESYFRHRLRTTESLQKGFIEGRKLCPVKVENAYTIRDIDESTPLKAIDYLVLGVLEAKGRIRGRVIKLTLDISDHVLLPALERLQENTKIRCYEGLYFNEYEAVED